MQLEELDLYDNKLKTVGDALDSMSSLACAMLLMSLVVF